MLVLIEYIVPPSGLGVLGKIKNSSKQVKERFYPHGETLHHKPANKMLRVQHRVQGEISKNLKSFTQKEKRGSRIPTLRTPYTVRVGLEVGHKPI